MRNLYPLLSARILGIKNSISGKSSDLRKRAMIVVTVGIAFWALMFILSSRMLAYFQSVEVIGDLLAHHLLSMIFLTFFTFNIQQYYYRPL